MTFNSYDLIGAPVQDSRGEPLGVVNEVLVDSDGHAFAIINHGDYDLAGEGGINTIVPFEALRVSRYNVGEEKDKVILKTDAEHLDLAPYYNPTQAFNRQKEAATYEFFGIQPYWTENMECSK